MNEWHPYTPRDPDSPFMEDWVINGFDSGLLKRANNPGLHVSFAQWLLTKTQYLWALKNLRRAVELDPDHLGANMSLASFLATCPNVALRDGRAAVRLAEKAYDLGVAKGAKDTEWMLRGHLTLLAAAYAQAGDWVHAVTHQRHAIQITCTQTHLSSLRANLDSYLKAQSVHALDGALDVAANDEFQETPSG
jgi:Flp pilus assembly protein TadD